MDDLASRLLKALQQEAGAQLQSNTRVTPQARQEVRHPEGTPIRRLQLRRETETLLALNGIRTVEQLRSTSRVDLLKIPHINMDVFSEIQRALRESTTETGELSIALLDLPGWVERPLKRKGINSIEALCELTLFQLLEIRGVGLGSIAELRRRLQGIGRDLSEE